jgi:hypothetical protein
MPGSWGQRGALRMEEEGFVITNKSGPEVRDYSRLSLTYGGVRAVKKVHRMVVCFSKTLR